jgi:hypothetical protein
MKSKTPSLRECKIFIGLKVGAWIEVSHHQPDLLEIISLSSRCSTPRHEEDILYEIVLQHFGSVKRETKETNSLLFTAHPCAQFSFSEQISDEEWDEWLNITKAFDNVYQNLGNIAISVTLGIASFLIWKSG